MKKKVYVLACGIRSMHNIGSIFRTCDGAGVQKLYLTGQMACPPRKEIHKTALGADQIVPWEYHSDPIQLIRRLKKERIQVMALEVTKSSQSLFQVKLKKSFCLVIGNEVEGVSASLLKECDAHLAIPMHGKKESLNVAVALGIAIYSLTH